MGGVLASRRELQDKGCSRSAASGSVGGRRRHLLRVRKCGHRCEAARARAPSRAPSHVHASVPQPARRPPIPLTLARVPIACIAGSTGGGGACTKTRRRRRRRGAHVPVEPWRVTPHAHLCDEGRVSILLHAVEYSVPNMNGECNVPSQSCTRENGGTLRRASKGGRRVLLFRVVVSGRYLVCRFN